MNNHRRKYIKNALSNINNAIEYIQMALFEEEDALNNMPENLESSNNYSKIEGNIDSMEEAIDGAESTKSILESIL